jgi:hypothetical protein
MINAHLRKCGEDVSGPTAESMALLLTLSGDVQRIVCRTLEFI